MSASIRLISLCSFFHLYLGSRYLLSQYQNVFRMYFCARVLYVTTDNRFSLSVEVICKSIQLTSINHLAVDDQKRPPLIPAASVCDGMVHCARISRSSSDCPFFERKNRSWKMHRQDHVKAPSRSAREIILYNNHMTSVDRDYSPDLSHDWSEDSCWIFGYGSLMWNHPGATSSSSQTSLNRPEFESVEQHYAGLNGYRRDLCMYSFMTRGTPGLPGLCLGLTAAEGEACTGIAFRIESKERDAAWKALQVHVLMHSVIPMPNRRGRILRWCVIERSPCKSL